MQAYNVVWERDKWSKQIKIDIDRSFIETVETFYCILAAAQISDP